MKLMSSFTDPILKSKNISTAKHCGVFKPLSSHTFPKFCYKKKKHKKYTYFHYWIKGIVHWKMTGLSWFFHSHVIQSQHVFLLTQKVHFGTRNGMARIGRWNESVFRSKGLKAAQKRIVKMVSMTLALYSLCLRLDDNLVWGKDWQIQKSCVPDIRSSCLDFERNSECLMWINHWFSDSQSRFIYELDWFRSKFQLTGEGNFSE